MKSLYLDYAATSPVRSEVLESMLPFMQNHFGNPGSLHDLGRDSFEAIEKARQQIADSIGAESAREIILTSSGTEANNLALVGTCYKKIKQGNHIITTKIEHPSILQTCKFLEKKGFEVSYLDVDKYGVVDIDQLLKEIKKNTILVSIMLANNEIGTIQPIKNLRSFVPKNISFHTDAIQYLGKAKLSVEDLEINLLSIGSHKIYGPKGVGALYVKKGTFLSPIIHGGSQERSLRASTENTPGIIGFGKACELAANEVKLYEKEISPLRDYCWELIKEEIGEVQLNGHPTKRLANNLNLSFKNIEGQAIMLELNRSKIYIASGSACSAGKYKPSHVLLATDNEEIALQSIRISFGNTTTKEDIIFFVKELKKAIFYLRTLQIHFARS